MSYIPTPKHTPLFLEPNDRSKNIGRNPIVNCERNGERNNRKGNNRKCWTIKTKFQLESGTKSPFRNWKKLNNSNSKLEK